MLSVLDVCSSQLNSSAGIPSKLAFTVATIIRIIQIVVPILLIIWGMLDLGRAVMAQKEDEIKKGQQTFIKRLIAAIIVFFVTTIVKLVVNLFADNQANIWSCVDAIINCKSPTCGD